MARDEKRLMKGLTTMTMMPSRFERNGTTEQSRTMLNVTYLSLVELEQFDYPLAIGYNPRADANHLLPPVPPGDHKARLKFLDDEPERRFGNDGWDSQLVTYVVAEITEGPFAGREIAQRVPITADGSLVCATAVNLLAAICGVRTIASAQRAMNLLVAALAAGDAWCVVRIGVGREGDFEVNAIAGWRSISAHSVRQVGGRGGRNRATLEIDTVAISDEVVRGLLEAWLIPMIVTQLLSEQLNDARLDSRLTSDILHTYNKWRQED